MDRTLELRTGCRLHFGLMELAPDQPLRYGGLGVMLDSPQVLLRASLALADAADHAPAIDLSTDVNSEVAADHTAAEFVKRVTAAVTTSTIASPPTHSVRMNLRVQAHPPLHSGLGCGTQLAAAAATLTRLATSARSVDDDSWQSLASPEDLHWFSVERLGQLSGRGKRSSIGLHGFLFGGLVQDYGHAPTSQKTGHRPVMTRSTPMPDAWRVVLSPGNSSGDMHGAEEDRLIEHAGHIANPRSVEMLDLSDTCMLAARTADFDLFVASLENYMDLAANLFAPVQAGKYRNADVAKRVAMAKTAGLRAVGQSSWGPTVFGFARDAQHAQQCLQSMMQSHGIPQEQLQVCRFMNQGAQWRQLLSEESEQSEKTSCQPT